MLEMAPAEGCAESAVYEGRSGRDSAGESEASEGEWLRGVSSASSTSVGDLRGGAMLDASRGVLMMTAHSQLRGTGQVGKKLQACETCCLEGAPAAFRR